MAVWKNLRARKDQPFHMRADMYNNLREMEAQYRKTKGIHTRQAVQRFPTPYGQATVVEYVNVDATADSGRTPEEMTVYPGQAIPLEIHPISGGEEGTYGASYEQAWNATPFKLSRNPQNAGSDDVSVNPAPQNWRTGVLPPGITIGVATTQAGPGALGKAVIAGPALTALRWEDDAYGPPRDTDEAEARKDADADADDQVEAHAQFGTTGTSYQGDLSGNPTVPPWRNIFANPWWMARGGTSLVTTTRFSRPDTKTGGAFRYSRVNSYGYMRVMGIPFGSEVIQEYTDVWDGSSTGPVPYHTAATWAWVWLDPSYNPYQNAIVSGITMSGRMGPSNYTTYEPDSEQYGNELMGRWTGYLQDPYNVISQASASQVGGITFLKNTINPKGDNYGLTTYSPEFGFILTSMDLMDWG